MPTKVLKFFGPVDQLNPGQKVALLTQQSVDVIVRV